MLQSINKAGVLLIFPIQNKDEPDSVWAHTYPRSKMIWDWTRDTDPKVDRIRAVLWDLVDEEKIILTKWYRDKPTIFSEDSFLYMLAYLRSAKKFQMRETKKVLDTLEIDSPQATQELKEACGLRGSHFKSDYNQAMRELWHRLLIVEHGEVKISHLPSTTIGSTEKTFGDIWERSLSINKKDAEKFLISKLNPENIFFKFAVNCNQKYGS